MGEQGRAAALVKRFGVAPIINAGGPNTLHAGSRPRDVVLAAMVEAAGLFFRMDELVIRAGEMIAAAVGAEAATVTAGAGSGLTLQTAAAITRGDPEKIARLPDTRGMANELIIQRRHRFVYDHLYLIPGARFVEVGDETGCDPDDLEAAITDKTVGLIHLESSFKQGGSVPLPTLAEIAHRHDLPVLCDAASRLPPRANLTRFLDEGADLVSFSGGKAVRGPQSTGMLLGKKDWVEWARLNNAPNATVGRAMKVSREEIVGLVAAVEAFVAVDEAAEMARVPRADANDRGPDCGHSRSAGRRRAQLRPRAPTRRRLPDASMAGAEPRNNPGPAARRHAAYLRLDIRGIGRDLRGPAEHPAGRARDRGRSVSRRSYAPQAAEGGAIMRLLPSPGGGEEGDDNRRATLS